jgi:hypothetical protein
MAASETGMSCQSQPYRLSLGSTAVSATGGLPSFALADLLEFAAAGFDNFEHISLLLHRLAGRKKARLGERPHKPAVLSGKVESLRNADLPETTA